MNDSLSFLLCFIINFINFNNIINIRPSLVN
nr:MAG TPA: hypothetical protein [Bacteriophage sp.]